MSLELSRLFIALGIAALGFACGPRPKPQPPPAPPSASSRALAPAPPPAPPATDAPPLVALADDAEAARAAAEILSEGGSAADAAVAALLVAGVTAPASSGLGGGGLALVWDGETRRARVLDFLPRAPAVLRPERLDRAGGAAIGVPGEAAGLAALHAWGGRRAFAELVRPALRRAEEGFALSPHMHRALRWREPWLRSSPLAAAFAPLGRLASRGEPVTRPALARRLKQLAAEGPASFYADGASLVDAARAAGSLVAPSDLASYRVEEREPWTLDWEGHQVIAPPPPSSGALTLHQTLLMHDAASLKALRESSEGAYLHVLAEGFRASAMDRHRRLGDPSLVTVDREALLDPDRLRARRARISADRTRALASWSSRESGTSNVIVQDAEGDVVIVTTSLNDLFGARVTSDDGVVLNDHLTTFATARDERRLGPSKNRAQPGARPVTSMSPTLVVVDGEPVLATCASGGEQMATAVSQAVLGRLVFGKDAKTLVSEPRVHAPSAGGLRLDAWAPEALRRDLEGRGEVVDSSRPLYGALLVVTWPTSRDRRGAVDVSTDPRKGGEGHAR